MISKKRRTKTQDPKNEDPLGKKRRPLKKYKKTLKYSLKISQAG
jgi:hypothetical protein